MAQWKRFVYSLCRYNTGYFNCILSLFQESIVGKKFSHTVPSAHVYLLVNYISFSGLFVNILFHIQRNKGQRVFYYNIHLKGPNL